MITLCIACNFDLLSNTPSSLHTHKQWNPNRSNNKSQLYFDRLFDVIFKCDCKLFNCIVMGIQGRLDRRMEVWYLIFSPQLHIHHFTICHWIIGNSSGVLCVKCLSNSQRYGWTIGAKRSWAGCFAIVYDCWTYSNHPVYSITNADWLEICISFPKAIIHKQRIHSTISLQCMVLSNCFGGRYNYISGTFDFHWIHVHFGCRHKGKHPDAIDSGGIFLYWKVYLLH